jgi:hypothetical protein
MVRAAKRHLIQQQVATIAFVYEEGTTNLKDVVGRMVGLPLSWVDLLIKYRTRLILLNCVLFLLWLVLVLCSVSVETGLEGLFFVLLLVSSIGSGALGGYLIGSKPYTVVRFSSEYDLDDSRDIGEQFDENEDRFYDLLEARYVASFNLWRTLGLTIAVLGLVLSTVCFARITDLELPSIGWQLFILDSSQSDPIALPAFLDTYATRLLTEPLSSAPCRLRSGWQ